jgi:hypothetical protein
MDRFGFRRPQATQGLLAAALLAFVLRALVPLGFMPMQVNGETQMMFCHGMHHAVAGTPHSKSSADGPCAFAISGGAAPAPTPLATLPTAEAPHFDAVTALRSADRPAPPRHLAPRGPPVLA